MRAAEERDAAAVPVMAVEQRLGRAMVRLSPQLMESAQGAVDAVGFGHVEALVVQVGLVTVSWTVSARCRRTG
jgi:hypothetical protein